METSEVQSFKKFSRLVTGGFYFFVFFFKRNEYNPPNYVMLMKIITWNINGIRAVERKGEIQNLIASHTPDVLFLQEIKGTTDKFSDYLRAPEGYEAFYNPAEKAGYAGTGVWIRDEWRKYVRAIETGFP